MPGLTSIRCQALRILTIVLALHAPLVAQGQAVDLVTTVKDENGWKLQVNGEDFYIRGYVWGYTPRNQNYTYNLWGESDEFIRKVLDYDFGLMRASGANAVRSFAMIPPKWVTYIYEQHDIMTVINPLMGRYGYTVGGKWVPFTDYSDELTRATLKKDMLELVAQYKDVPGVLMFAFGNESNYGLSWSSFEIENLPEGEQNTAKARYLYSLFNEVMKAGKSIAPDHLFSIVNGDIQYIDLIAEYCTDMDVLGSNAYRGKSFTSLWEEVDEKLDLPVLFFEFGSDAFNARTHREDQQAQATILRDQWLEMYNKSYGHGEEGNSIGGFVFEWRDEWWKYLQVENLEIQDDNASWSNQAYPFDWAEGKNNMNEEWFGVTALGTPNSDGVYTARPRMAYDVLSQIWHTDPHQAKKASINKQVEELDMEYLALKGDVRLLKEESEEQSKILHLTGGSLLTEFVLKGTQRSVKEDGEEGVEFSDGEMIFLDFAFEPTDRLDGQFTINILGNVADTEPLEIQYGRRGLPITVLAAREIEGAEVILDVTLDDRDRVEIYDFSTLYEGDHFDLKGFYHTPRYHWGYEGDFFGLIREATDIAGMDIWNAKAPQGVEAVGKGAMDGFKFVFGPEIYWGANPKWVVKYTNSWGKFDYTFMHAEDVAQLTDSATATEATDVQTRQTTFSVETDIVPGVKTELGVLIGSSDKVDDDYTRVEGDEVILDEVEWQDTLGVKGKFTFPVFDYQGYLGFNVGGIVADGGAHLKEFGTRLPYADFGNKREVDGGLMMNFGNWMVFPRFLYRDNYVGSNPNRDSSIIPCPDNPADECLDPGSSARSRNNDAFAVLDNRTATAGELFITYDPTGETPFYAWDNVWRENAKFAFNVGFNYTNFRSRTDSYEFFFEPTSENAAFGVGLPEEDTWEASTRMVFNPTTSARIVSNLRGGKLQSTGDPDGGAREFFELDAKFVYRNRHIVEGYAKYDAFGPYDFHRQFNITFPYQYKVDYSILLDELKDELHSTKIGVRALLRGVDEDSPLDEYEDGENSYLWQTVFYFDYNF